MKQSTLQSIKGQYLHQKNPFNTIDYLLLTLWAVGFAIAGWLVCVIFIIGFHDIKTIAPLIGALAILISAGIASTSVMKSIHVSKLNEERKHKKEESKFYLDKSIEYLVRVYNLLCKRPREIFPWREATSILLDIKKINQYITEESHKKIFEVEYLQYSSKLFEAILKTEKGVYSAIKPEFFCLDINIDTDLKTAFKNSQLKMSPMFIIPVFDFAEPKNNNFIENELDYENWEKLDLSRDKNSLLSLCVLEYINLYRESEVIS